MIKRAQELNMGAIALTDHGVMYGVVEFYQHCRKANIKPIIGVEAYVARDSLKQKGRGEEKPYHLVLLAKNNQGYENLLRLTTVAHLEGYYYKPRLDWSTLQEFSEGLIALSACRQGEVAKAVMSGEEDRAKQIIQKAISTFGDGNFYLELQHHPNAPEQQQLNQALIRLSRELGVPLVATNDSHYLRPEDAEAQDALLCIQTKNLIAEESRISYRGFDLSLRSGEQMIESFRDIPEAISNTVKIAAMCEVELPLGKVILPHYELPNHTTANQELRRLTEEGLLKRYPGKQHDEQINQRLEYELEVINKTGFAAYFLIVQDFVNWAKQNKILVGPGRGSAAGSLVSYLINITDLDPLQHNLMFERFLNPERISMPDIDLDFADIRRDEVINYVSQKYGYDKVCQIITFGTMAARAAIRDVGRVLGFSYGYCDRLAKMVPAFDSLTEALKEVPELKDIYQQDLEAKRLIDLAKRVEGVARHTSTHACGVLITPERLDNYVPLQRASSSDETIVSQYSLHPIEDLGLLKMDFLGLSNLTIIETALKIIAKTTGRLIDLDTLPLNDKKTYELFQRGETVGVFQFESSGMRRYLRQLKPTEFEDLVAMGALYRPGPMEFIPDYIAGKHGYKKISYLHPKLKPILEKTYGIAVYQEQVLQIARELAGFTYGQADVLRKAVGKKIKSLLDEQGEKLINGMIKNDIDKRTAERIWEFIIPFARYGFNRAHAACYGMISYHTAYLKANYPAQFMAALLASDQNHIDRVAIDVMEAQKLNLKVLPPDINESFPSFAVVPSPEGNTANTIRFGLAAVKNVGSAVAEAIVEERKARGVYQNLTNFLERVHHHGINRKALESLIKAGALDRFSERGQLLANVDKLSEFNRRITQHLNMGQTGLFDTTGGLTAKLQLGNAPPANNNEILTWEKELLGLYISDHPLRHLAAFIKGVVVPISLLTEYIDKTIKVAIIINSVKRIITKNGQAMLACIVEDAQGGSCELVVFPKVLDQGYGLWRPEATLLLTARVSDKDGVLKLLAESAEYITAKPDLPPANKTERITLTLSTAPSPAIINKIKQILLRYPGPLPFYIAIKTAGADQIMKSSLTVADNPTLITELNEIFNSEEINIKRE